jgi:hypothetical protein
MQETARNTEVYMGGWNQNGSYGDCVWGCGVDPIGSG